MNKNQGGILVLVVVVVACAAATPIDIGLSSQKGKLVAVKANEGNIVGMVTTEAGIFWGVPFSQPPINDFRWMRPRDPVNYTEPYWNATYKRPGCDQICNLLVPEYSCPTETSEDCLYLNVFVPKRLLKGTEAKDPLNEKYYEIDPSYLPGGNKTPLPVMIWLYGGNFLNGAGSAVLYDGRYMAYKGDVIVVTTNYRTAHLGFLMQGTQGEESQGNFGFWDQVKAMEWVQNNIAMFGGNHNLVTLFGQSAGAESIGIHLTSNVSDHLFHQAIMQSNPFALPLRYKDGAKEFGDRFATNANCTPDDMTCLRTKTVQQLQKAFNETSALNSLDEIFLIQSQPWGPVIDGDVVPELPLRMFAQNKVQNKPMLMGATVGEGVGYVWADHPNPINNELYTLSLQITFKTRFLEVLSVYPPVCNESTVDCDNRDVLAQVATEFLFECPQRKAINSTRSQNYLYSFNQTWSINKLLDDSECSERVCHASELAYAFGIEDLTVFTHTKEEKELSERMIRYWTNFAHQGDPNDYLNLDLLEWPTFFSNGEIRYKVMELKGAGDNVLISPYKHNCDFWDTFDGYGDY